MSGPKAVYPEVGTPIAYSARGRRASCTSSSPTWEITELASPSTATPEHYDKTYNIIARGTFFTIQKAVPLMTAGGSIVTEGSVHFAKAEPCMKSVRPSRV